MTKSLMIISVLMTLATSTTAQTVEPVWTNTNQANFGNSAWPNGIEVDFNGNVYVCGVVEQSTNDAFVVKYSSEGDSLWGVTYNGPGNGIDEFMDLALSADGDICAVGFSLGSGTDYDYITIKYDSASGTPVWVERHDGAGSGVDVGRAIAVADSQYTFVTGTSYGGSASYQDIVTIRYDTSGAVGWARMYLGLSDTSDAGLDIALDAGKNVYVAGTCADSDYYGDFYVRQWLFDGSPGWSHSYDGSAAASADTAFAITATLNGTVYATGIAKMTGQDYNYMTIKYDQSGTPVWTRTYNGTGNGVDIARDIVLDNQENVIVTGRSLGSGSGIDIVTIKYDSSGVPLWTRRYSEPGAVMDQGYAVDVDAYDNIYIVGSASSGATNQDYALLKYKPNGDFLWIKYHNGSDDNIDIATDIAVDRFGNAYTTGFEMNDSYVFKTVTTRYSFLGPLRIRAYSPVNLNVIDPVQDSIGKDAFGNLTQTIFPADYFEDPPDYDDEIVIYYPIEGEYTVKVIAEDGAPPGATYSASIRLDGSQEVVIVANAMVPDAAADSYDYTVDEDYNYRNADANGDEIINILDITFMINYLYKGGAPPYPPLAGDADCNLILNILDITYMISYLYKGGPPPCFIPE